MQNTKTTREIIPKCKDQLGNVVLDLCDFLFFSAQGIKPDNKPDKTSIRDHELNEQLMFLYDKFSLCCHGPRK